VVVNPSASVAVASRPRASNASASVSSAAASAISRVSPVGRLVQAQPGKSPPDTEVGRQEDVGIAEGPHRDVVGGPRADPGQRQQRRTYVGAVGAPVEDEAEKSRGRESSRVPVDGGGIVGKQLYGLDPNSYIASARNGIDIDDVLGGVIKPIVFGFIIGVVSCFRGLNTTGGTVGVGKATTNAVVTASICVIIADFFLSKILQTLFKTGIF